MFRIIFIVGTGGFLGSVARYLSSQFVARYVNSTLPYGTLSVNIVGCFLIGIIYALADRGNILSPEWRIFLATGFCGGFTTFSSFSYESMNLMRDGQILYLFLYLAISIIIGFAATYAGISIIKSI